eukprot:3104109-Prymnesium_polylepis.1
MKRGSSCSSKSAWSCVSCTEPAGFICISAASSSCGAGVDGGRWNVRPQSPRGDGDRGRALPATRGVARARRGIRAC